MTQCIGHTHNVNCLKRNEEIVISGSTDNTVKVWDLRSSVCERTLVGHTSPVMCLDFDVDAYRLVSGSYDKTIRVWDVRRMDVAR